MIEKLGPFGPQPHLAVALSGGADSLALTLLADQWAQTHGGRITALTVDHGLRAESAVEARSVQEQMQGFNIAHHILTPAHTSASNNFQESARQWRYDALADWCHAHDVLHCLIAHHAGDQRETIALHRARGDTADGESGMALVRNYRGVRFLRPLLGQEKETLTAYLTAKNILWVEDPSNRNHRFARVRTRQQLLQNPAQRGKLSTLAATEGAARAARDEALAHIAAMHVSIHPNGYAEIPHDVWCALPQAQATQLLADLLTTISGATHRPRRGDVERLAVILRSLFKRRTLHGCEISLRHGTTIRIAREYARVVPPLALSGEGVAFWDHRFRVSYALPAGMRLTLAALGTHKKSHRPQGAQDMPRATPAVAQLDRLVFIPHIDAQALPLPDGAHLAIGFAPAKPLAAAPFWWLK